MVKFKRELFEVSKVVVADVVEMFCVMMAFVILSPVKWEEGRYF